MISSDLFHFLRMAQSFFRFATDQGATVVVSSTEGLADVDQRGVGAHAEDNTLHGAGIVVARAEIGEKSDNGARHAPVILSPGRFSEQHLAHLALHQERVGDAKIL